MKPQVLDFERQRGIRELKERIRALDLVADADLYALNRSAVRRNRHRLVDLQRACAERRAVLPRNRHRFAHRQAVILNGQRQAGALTGQIDDRALRDERFSSHRQLFTQRHAGRGIHIA